MTLNDFKKVQYQTIRKEIEDTRERIFKMAAFGIVVVPGAQSIAEKQEPPLLLYFIPAIIIGIVFVHMAEKASLIRCGLFIKTYIETNELSGWGWEHWLEKNPPKRNVDKYVTIAFYILFAAYYILSVVLIWQDLKTHTDILLGAPYSNYVVMAFYALVGVVVFTHICFQFKHLTSTSNLGEENQELRQELRQLKVERDGLRQRLAKRTPEGGPPEGRS